MKPPKLTADEIHALKRPYETSIPTYDLWTHEGVIWSSAARLGVAIRDDPKLGLVAQRMYYTLTQDMWKGSRILVLTEDGEYVCQGFARTGERFSSRARANKWRTAHFAQPQVLMDFLTIPTPRVM